MKISITESKGILYKIGAILFWIILWEILFRMINREIYLPSPYKTMTALIELIKLKVFWSIVFTTISRVIIGLAMSCGLGIIIGIICGLNTYVYQLFQPLMVAIKSTPVMSFIIIALIWFKSGLVPVFICFLMCFPIIWTSTVKGIQQVDQKLLEMAKIYSVSRFHVIEKIYFPSTIPYITAGMVTALGIGWKVTVAAEVLSNPRLSIGANLYNAKVYLESEKLFAWTIVIIVLSMIFEYIFKKFMNKLSSSRRVKDV